MHDCLQAIARQTVMPLEVIVVDNNSTDATAAIAARWPFVRLLRESQQGVVHARNRGFAAARGDIIARIDADTIITADWVATLQSLFAENNLDVVTGLITYREIALARTVGRLDLFWRRRMARLLGDEVAVQGANMALRREVWQTIANQTCHQAGMHEDFDIAIHANQAGYRVRFVEKLRASVCYRQADYDFKAFAEYALISPRTYLQHGLHSGRFMYQVVAFVVVLYPIISALNRGYDLRLGRFSLLKYLSSTTPPRVNPATYVD